MENDALFEALEKKRKEKRLKKIFRDPIGLFRENPLRLGYISGAFGALLMVMSYLFEWEFVARYDAYILSGIIAVIPPASYLYIEQRRIKKADDEFPILLRDLAQAKRAGLTLIDALTLTAEGNYGVLTEGLQTLTYQLTWGIPFEDALRLFAKRYPTRIIKRSVEIIIEGYQVGGDIGEILKVAANDVLELRTLEKKRGSDMGQYVIICYATFFVFIGVLLVLYHTFIPMMVNASEKVAGTGMVGAFSVRVDVDTMKMLFFHCGIVEGICSGLVAGKLGEGKIIAGLKHVTALTLVTFLFFAILKMIPPMIVEL